MAIRITRRLKYLVVLAVITVLLYGSIGSPQFNDLKSFSYYKGGTSIGDETYDGVFDKVDEGEDLDLISAPPIRHKETAPIDFEIPDHEKGSPESVPVPPKMPIVAETTHQNQAPGTQEAPARLPTTLDTTVADATAVHDDINDEPKKNLLPSIVQQPLADDEKFKLGRQERFPVAKEDLIRLPSDQNAKIPKIQTADPSLLESKAEKQIRLERQSEIREVFKRDWAAYKKYAWMHDELRPISNASRDPFGGWGATLVDALDTLVIMNLDEQYQEASEAVGKIDFTYTLSRGIPLFETTIRYLGGLLSAYDLGVAKGKRDYVLLSQAKILGQVLYGAFDTPNRLPILRYDYRRQAQDREIMRSEAAGCMAEVGSLSVEFTRLAQLSDGDDRDKFFDAIQRITNALEESMSYMDIPGLWPLSLDLSGCEPRRAQTTQVIKAPPREGQGISPKEGFAALSKDDDLAMPKEGLSPSTSSKDESTGPLREGLLTPPKDGLIASTTKVGPNFDLEKAQKVTNDLLDVTKELHSASKKVIGVPEKRQIDVEPLSTHQQEVELAPHRTSSSMSKSPSTPKQPEVCIEQGIRIPPGSHSRTYSQGGQADSTYEYFTKEYLLLGGGAAATQYQTLYEKSIDATKKHLLFRPLVPEGLGASKLLMAGDLIASGKNEPELHAKMQHLTCFIGGMFAMGAKVFSRPEDLKLAAKLTDGCVWAYSFVPAGVAPEVFHLHVCKDEECSWQDFLDESARTAALPTKDTLAKAPEWAAQEAPTGKMSTAVAKREPQRPDVMEDSLSPNRAADLTTVNYEQSQKTKARTPPPASQHDELKQPLFWVDGRYILRPEAIESVWYMYRITGDKAWQEKGWKMWKSIDALTRTAVAHTAVDNIMDLENLHLSDSLESFWFAETLKYFYLLFSDFETVSLDEYVLNTEAHPLKRPSP